MNITECEINAGLISSRRGGRRFRYSCSEHRTCRAGMTELQGAVVSFCDPFGDGKTQPGTALRIRTSAGLVATKEALEDSRLQLRGNSGAIVGERYYGAIGRGARCD